MKQVSWCYSMTKLAKMPQNMKSSDRFRTVFDSSVLSFFNKSIRIQNLQMLNANINCSSKNNILKKVIFDYCIHPSLLVHWRKWLFPSISYITCYAAQIRKRLLNYWIKKKENESQWKCSEWTNLLEYQIPARQRRFTRRSRMKSCKKC